MSEEAWRVVFAPAAERDLRRVPPDTAARLQPPIRALGGDPYPQGSGKVRGADFWRIRVGDVRVIYTVDRPARRVLILRVARRSERTYRRLR